MDPAPNSLTGLATGAQIRYHDPVMAMTPKPCRSRAASAAGPSCPVSARPPAASPTPDSRLAAFSEQVCNPCQAETALHS